MPRAGSSATAFSSDGEATVYREGDFRGDFTLRYEAFARVQSRNTTWSTLSVTLLGGPPPADAITVGLVPEPGGAHVFTSIARRGANAFHDTGIVCAGECAIGLRGAHGSISATVEGTSVRSWPRFAFSLPHPTVQLNAEVSGPGDRIDAALTPLEERAARRLPPAICAFSTQGVVPTSVAGTFRFSGAFVRGAPAYYLDLRNGRRLEHCLRSAAP
jgi:hypothetical protein